MVRNVVLRQRKPWRDGKVKAKAVIYHYFPASWCVQEKFFLTLVCSPKRDREKFYSTKAADAMSSSFSFVVACTWFSLWLKVNDWILHKFVYQYLTIKRQWFEVLICMLNMMVCTIYFVCTYHCMNYCVQWKLKSN